MFACNGKYLNNTVILTIFTKEMRTCYNSTNKYQYSVYLDGCVNSGVHVSHVTACYVHTSAACCGRFFKNNRLIKVVVEMQNNKTSVARIATGIVSKIFRYTKCPYLCVYRSAAQYKVEDEYPNKQVHSSSVCLHLQQSECELHIIIESSHRKLWSRAESSSALRGTGGGSGLHQRTDSTCWLSSPRRVSLGSQDRVP